MLTEEEMRDCLGNEERLMLITKATCQSQLTRCFPSNILTVNRRSDAPSLKECINIEPLGELRQLLKLL